jgi:hypothetical protein
MARRSRKRTKQKGPCRIAKKAWQASRFLSWVDVRWPDLKRQPLIFLDLSLFLEQYFCFERPIHDCVLFAATSKMTKRKERHDDAVSQEGETRKHKEEKESGDSSSDDDDDDDALLKAVAEWAANEDSKSGSATDVPVQQQHPSAYSLHVTQLSFQATDYDVRSLFVNHGCFVTSVRLVYDTDPFSKNRTFRGVAFVDVSDNESYKKALQLDRFSFKGRKINVRPTRSKTELANIVERTKEKVASKIEQSRSKSVSKAEDSTSSKARNQKKRRRDVDVPSGEKQGQSSNSDHRSNKASRVERSHHHRRHRCKKSDHKPTKKERNRRAAIIASLARRKGQK